MANVWRAMKADLARAKEKQSNTVKVRIAVAVDENGNWAAFGAKGKDDLSYIRKVVFHEAHVVFIEAELPVPEIQTIQAKVSE